MTLRPCWVSPGSPGGCRGAVGECGESPAGEAAPAPPFIPASPVNPGALMGAAAESRPGGTERAGPGVSAARTGASPGGRTQPSGRGWCRPARPSLLLGLLPPLLFLCVSPRRLLGPPGHSPVALCLLSRERWPSCFPRGITSSLPQADRFPRGISLNRTHAHSRSSSRGARRSAASGGGRFLGARTVEAEGAGGHRAGPAGCGHAPGSPGPSHRPATSGLGAQRAAQG